MVEAKAGSASKDNRSTDAATSGKNASASTTSKNSNGAKETTKSWTEETEDGTITKKLFTRSGNNDSDDKSDGSWTLFGDGSSSASQKSNREKENGGEDGTFASAGKGAFAGVVNGKAFASAE